MFKEIQYKQKTSELPITFSGNKRFKDLSEARSESEPLEQ